MLDLTQFPPQEGVLEESDQLGARMDEQQFAMCVGEVRPDTPPHTTSPPPNLQPLWRHFHVKMFEF